MPAHSPEDKPNAGNGNDQQGQNESNDQQGQEMGKDVRTWLMVLLTVVFVGLYVATLFGWIQPAGEMDQNLLLRLEPVVFAIIGYFFGREPSVRTENRLSAEAEKERKQRAAAEEKEKRQLVRAENAVRTIRDAQAALGASAPRTEKTDLPETLSRGSDVNEGNVRQGAAAAAAILATY